MRVTACRAIAALPVDQRPAALKDLKVRVIALKAVPGAMQYDVKEVKAKAGEILDPVKVHGTFRRELPETDRARFQAEVGRMSATLASK